MIKLGDLRPGGEYVYTHTVAESWAHTLAGGAASVAVVGTPVDRVHVGGNDPYTGAVVPPQDYDSASPPVWPPQEGDWFAQLASFGAGMGDAVSGGLTKRVRVGLGYDDAVNYGSGAYTVGKVAGTAVSVATAFANPCAVGGLAGNALRGLNAVQGAASALDAGDAFASGDAVGGMMALAGARASFGKSLQACFAAGTPIVTPGGSVAIESLKSYEDFGDACDSVLSRDEFDARAPVIARRVLRAFARVSPVIDVLVEGRTVVTTGEHPFWVAGQGWTPASELRAGDTLVSHDGQELPVSAVRDAGRVASVYNVEVEHDHTYFVGSSAWGYAVWAHNAKCDRFQGRKPAYHVNPPHVPGHVGFNPAKTPLPADAAGVYRTAVPDSVRGARHWYGQNQQGKIYKFSNGGDGTAHFSAMEGAGDGVRGITRYALWRLGRGRR